MVYDEFMIIEIIRDYLSDVEQEYVEDVYVKMNIKDGVKRLIFTTKTLTDESDLNVDLQLGDFLKGELQIE